MTISIPEEMKEGRGKNWDKIYVFSQGYNTGEFFHTVDGRNPAPPGTWDV